MIQRGVIKRNSKYSPIQPKKRLTKHELVYNYVRSTDVIRREDLETIGLRNIEKSVKEIGLRYFLKITQINYNTWAIKR